MLDEAFCFASRRNGTGVHQQVPDLARWTGGNSEDWSFFGRLAVSENALEIVGGFAGSVIAMEASDDFLAIPPAVTAVIAPGKTLFWEVSASDQSGKTLGTSGVRSFRLFVEPR